jgi:hypothetical protein
LGIDKLCRGFASRKCLLSDGDWHQEAIGDIGAFCVRTGLASESSWCKHGDYYR